MSGEELQHASKLRYTNQTKGLEECNFFIVTVPTPIDHYKQPDLKPLIKASETIAEVLKKGMSLYMNRQFILVRLKKFVCLYLKKCQV